MASQRTISFVVSLLLALSYQVGTRLNAHAQSPESCEGRYSGDYDGSFIGVIRILVRSYDDF